MDPSYGLFTKFVKLTRLKKITKHITGMYDLTLTSSQFIQRIKFTSLIMNNLLKPERLAVDPNPPTAAKEWRF